MLALSVATSGRANAPLTHTCSVTDRQFLETAKTNMTALGLWGQQYLSGDAKAKEVVDEAKTRASELPADLMKSVRQTTRKSRRRTTQSAGTQSSGSASSQGSQTTRKRTATQRRRRTSSARKTTAGR
jgi:hypothetical protein